MGCHQSTSDQVVRFDSPTPAIFHSLSASRGVNLSEDSTPAAQDPPVQPMDSLQRAKKESLRKYVRAVSDFKPCVSPTGKDIVPRSQTTSSNLGHSLHAP